MKYNKLKNTDMQVSDIGLGTWVFGGQNWGGSKERDCIKAVHAALDSGVNFIDTAPIYGFGRAEQIVGKAIKNKRDKVILATKCGLVWQGKNITHNLTAISIKKEIEDSLQRLRVDCIDLYQCHWPDPNTPINETMEVLNQLKEEGKIRHIGVSNFEKELFEQASQYTEIVSLQSQYSLLERSLEDEMIPYCRERNVGVIAYGVLGGGILSGKYKESPEYKGADVRSFFYKFYRGAEFERTHRLLLALQKINRSLNQIALNWVRKQKGMAVTLAGARNVQQAKDNIESTKWELSEEEMKFINSIVDHY